MIERLGWEVEVTDSGLAAVERTLSTSFDVVLLDLGLHDIDGTEAARRIRGSEIHRRTPLVAITGDSSAHARERCMTSGMDDFLAKPISIPALRSALARWAVTDDRKRVASERRVPIAAEQETLVEQVLLDASGGDRKIISDVTQTFLRDGEQRLEELHRAVAENDVPRRVRFAHKLKGASSMVGARRLAALCAELESELVEDARGKVESIGRELLAVRERMGIWLAGG